jgi:hypothetical protein
MRKVVVTWIIDGVEEMKKLVDCLERNGKRSMRFHDFKVEEIEETE